MAPPFAGMNDHSPLPPPTTWWQSLRPSHLARGLDSRREPEDRLQDLWGVVVVPG